MITNRNDIRQLQVGFFPSGYRCVQHVPKCSSNRTVRWEATIASLYQYKPLFPSTAVAIPTSPFILKQLHSTVPRNLIKTENPHPRPCCSSQYHCTCMYVATCIRYRSKPLYVFLHFTYQKMPRHEATCERNHHDIDMFIQIGTMSSCQNYHREPGSIPAIIVPPRSRSRSRICMQSHVYYVDVN